VAFSKVPPLVDNGSKMHTADWFYMIDLVREFMLSLWGSVAIHHFNVLVQNLD
jgi:hypothetical protein